MIDKQTKPLMVWILQTGEPLHIDDVNTRPMRAINLSNSLVKSGHKVVLWSSGFYHQRKRHRSTSYLKINVTENLEIRLIPSRGYKQNIGVERMIDHIQLAFNLKRILNKEKSLPNAAFIGYPPIETAAIFSRWLSKRGIPFLLDIKDQWPSLFLGAIPEFIRPFGAIIFLPYFYLARRAMKDAKGFSGMSDGYLEWAYKFAGRERSDLDGIFPLTSPKGGITQAQKDDARKWWDRKGILNDGRFRVCFIGTHSRAFDFYPIRKAAESALKRKTKCEFIICGSGESTGAIQAMLADLPNVHFPGWIDRPKIETLAERCMAALTPYQNIENFTRNIPNKVVDAFSLGLPILSPLNGEVASLIEKYKVGICYGIDTGKTLFDCIEELTKDNSLQGKLSNNALVLYEKRFSFDKVYGKLVNHLEMLADVKIEI